MPVNERLKQWLEQRKSANGETQTFLGEKLGYKKAYFSGMKNGKDKVNIEFVQLLLNYDTQVNASCLLLGDGEMYKNEKHLK